MVKDYFFPISSRIEFGHDIGHHLQALEQLVGTVLVTDAEDQVGTKQAQDFLHVLDESTFPRNREEDGARMPSRTMMRSPRAFRKSLMSKCPGGKRSASMHQRGTGRCLIVGEQVLERPIEVREAKFSCPLALFRNFLEVWQDIFLVTRRGVVAAVHVVPARDKLHRTFHQGWHDDFPIDPGKFITKRIELLRVTLH